MIESEHAAYELLMRHRTEGPWIFRDCILINDAVKAVIEAYEAGKREGAENQREEKGNDDKVPSL